MLGLAGGFGQPGWGAPEALSEEPGQGEAGGEQLRERRQLKLG